MTLREEEGARDMVNILSAQLDCASYSVVVRNYKTRKITKERFNLWALKNYSN
jgi:hypothetical protein